MDAEHDFGKAGPVLFLFTTEKTEAYKQCAQSPEVVIMEGSVFTEGSRTLLVHPHLTVKRTQV